MVPHQGGETYNKEKLMSRKTLILKKTSGLLFPFVDKMEKRVLANRHRRVPNNGMPS